jgi:hypothetical protein
MAKTPPKDKGTTHDKPVTTAGQLDADKTPASGAGATGAPGSDQVAETTSQENLAAAPGGAAQSEGAAKGSTQADTATVDAAGDTATPTPDEARARSGATRTYRVGSVPIRHDQAFYDVGQPLELTDAQADRLGHLVTPAFETPEE